MLPSTVALKLQVYACVLRSLRSSDSAASDSAQAIEKGKSSIKKTRMILGSVNLIQTCANLRELNVKSISARHQRQMRSHFV